MMSSHIYCHASFKSIVGRISEVHKQAGDRKYSLIITGLSGSGKSSLGEWYEAKYTDDDKHKSVIYVELCQPSSSLNFVAQIIEAIGVPILNRRPSFSGALHQLKRIIQERNIEMLILDEVQECLPDKDGIKAQQMAKTLVSIINLCAIPTVLMGTPSVTRIIELDYLSDGQGLAREEQLSSRFLAPVSLNHLNRRNQDWQETIAFFKSKHSLRIDVENEDLLDRIYVASQGKIGFIDRLFSFVDKNQTENPMELFFESYQICDTTKEVNPFNPRSCRKDFVQRRISKLIKQYDLR
ncbi:ATP-binding protein [Pseudoalteromonas sp. T1lg24]|uniref:ATP-binding protein n=1 Tax=Pseudoalteromonas sp. T1lg24 TaxID=2077099 RepID=UPI000CF6D286|nr:ATP-binding protein [Pseudoalteromonas sp. T1lg24]